MNERQAITLCLQQRDPRGFEFLVQQYSREAFRHALGFLNSRAEAEDACQESFTRAFAAMPGLGSLPAFYPWFYQILKNGCLNRIRARRETCNVDEYPVPVTATPETDASKAETQHQVRHALNQLKPEFREILMLKHMHDMTYDAISHLLGIPRGTVMSRLYHARRAFQGQYGEKSDD